MSRLMRVLMNMVNRRLCEQSVWMNRIAYKVCSVKPWPNGLASQHKFTKPGLAYGHAKGGQKDSQVAESRKFHAYNWLVRFYNNRLLSAINLCRLTPGGQTEKNLRLLTSKFELDQVNASRRKWVAKRNASWTQVQNLRRLASPFGQRLNVKGYLYTELIAQ